MRKSISKTYAPKQGGRFNTISDISHDPLDIMTVLEVEAQFDEHAFCAFYVVKRDGLILDVALPLAEPRAEITLRHNGMAHPIVQFSFWGGDIRRLVDRRGELLEFSECLLGNIDLDGEDVTTNSHLPTCSILLWVKPQIRIQIA